VTETAVPGWTRAAGEGEARWFFGNLVTVKVPQAETGGLFSLVEMHGADGDMPPLHLHVDDDEVFYVLDGRMAYYVDSETLEVGSGGTVFAPKRVPHTYRVTSQEGARWLVTTAPGSFESFVVAASRPADSPSLPPASDPPTHDQIEAFKALALEHGIEILGPPGMLPTEL
jgi:mannose-6-phosphate isomerase-like protein (cupin superfamily)